ncbi:MAG: pilus assembly protein PilM [Planctomycetaceae bacterium]|nr:pilus assembly protein PilM [Planctomycetaceae bacterium]
MMLTKLSSKPNHNRSARVWGGGLKLGLEISDHEARMVVGRQSTAGWDMLRAGRMTLPASLAETPSATAAAIAVWLRREAGATPGDVVATLPTSLFEYESVPVSAEEVAGTNADATARQLMIELLGEQLDEFSFDYFTSESNQGTKLHLAWAARSILVPVAEGLSRSGWRIAAFDLPVVALARWGQFTERPASQLIVELNDTDANFVWAINGTPNYLRTRITIGSQPPAQLVSTRRRVSLATAETSLAVWGIDPTELPALAELNESCLNDWLERLGYEIHRTLQFIHGGMPASSTQEVVLCGAGAGIKGLDVWLSQQLSTSVSIATLPTWCRWRSAAPYRPSYAIALANSQYGVVR